MGNYVALIGIPVMLACVLIILAYFGVVDSEVVVWGAACVAIITAGILFVVAGVSLYTAIAALILVAVTWYAIVGVAIFFSDIEFTLPLMRYY